MNEALVSWLMAPDAEAVPLTLEDYLHRPEWQQDGACRGQGTAHLVIERASNTPSARCVRTVLCERSASMLHLADQVSKGSGAGPRRWSGGRCGAKRVA